MSEMGNVNIYEYLLYEVEHSSRFKINLIDKTLSINGKEIDLNGNNLISRDTVERIIESSLTNETPCTVLEKLYEIYKTSAPSEMYYGNKPYFKALSVEELDDYQIIFNKPRNFAQACLEGYVLLASLSGLLVWDKDDRWFWQSAKDRDLVVLREWIE